MEAREILLLLWHGPIICKRNTATIAVTAFRLMANKLVSDFLLHGSVFFLTNFFQLLFAIAIFNVFARSHFLIITVFHIYQFLSFTMVILYHFFWMLVNGFFMNLRQVITTHRHVFSIQKIQNHLHQNKIAVHQKYQSSYPNTSYLESLKTFC